MPAADVIEIVGLLEVAGVELWVDGGWGVDAALGGQTRPHADLDVIVESRHEGTLRAVLGDADFRHVRTDSDSNFVLGDERGREVDVHLIVFDASGNGVYRLASGEDWVFPSAGFAFRGRIGGGSVRCLTPEVQVLTHEGYEFAEKDYADMAALEARFGVELLPAQVRSRA